MKTIRGVAQSFIGLVVLAGFVLILVLVFRSVNGAVGSAPAATQSASESPAQTQSGYPAPEQTQSGYPAPEQTLSGYPAPDATSVAPVLTLAPTSVQVVTLNPPTKNPTPWLTFTPPVQPTIRPGPSETPLPINKPALDSAGVIIYASSEPADSLGRMSDITLASQQIDGSGKPAGAPASVNVGSISAYEILASPDGSRVAIISGSEAGDSVNIVNMTSGQVEPLFKGPTVSSGRFLGWRPDGHHVLYDAIDSGPNSGLWLVDVDTEEITILVRDPEGSSAIHAAAFSPDGQSVVYTHWRGFGSMAELRMINSDGTEPQVLLSAPTDPGSISWSPDGRMIAMMSDDKLATMDLATRTIVTYPSAFGPAIWSPDSQKMAYVYADETADQKGQPPDAFRGRTIHVIDVATSKDQPLIDEVGDIDPAWSPDSSQIAFVSLRSGSPEIWSVNTDGSNLRAITSGSQYVRFPIWRR